ncbi:GMC oxidoreductase [Paenibacillus aceris]|uniref:Choline dehydrogenase-like flavoprotein n=1 Tax=Paenibacillus aceris TaxID=869555 RepID=A0ABS4I1G6_9BACL|nr:GMC family oxidoreductase [Paenibacillus aceris]MBP1964565.1 choline dehydrogenase-like flavoprotein [Paenibacillus aceris]NHW35726.1 GMC family oxidoreductase [Paenibacillus aceris]
MKIHIVANRNKPVDMPICSSDIPTDYMVNWIPTVSLEEMASTEYDAIIIGSGAGGGAVLWRLCEHWKNSGKRIAMLEAGDALIPTHVNNIVTMNEERAAKYLANPQISKTIGGMSSEFPGALLVSILGGRTVFWGAVTPRLHASEFETWPITFQEMEKYYNIAEEAMNVSSLYTQGSSYTNVLLQRLRAHGYPQAQPMPLATDLQTTQYGQIHSNSFFSSIVFLGRAIHLNPFDLAVKARAVRIFTDNHRASGVKVMTADMKSFVIKAKNVIVSASTLESPRLLLSSGIPGKAIGHYLSNHSIVIAPATIKRTEFPELLGVLGIMLPYSVEQPFQVQIGGDFWRQEEQIPLRDKLQFVLSTYGRVEPRFENKISLDPNRIDRYGMPEIKIHFSYSDKDKEVIRQASATLSSISLAMGSQIETQNGIPDICRRPEGRPFHDFGTCRMGHNSATSVTNRYGQIHGISGLFVADNSVLPSNGGANPTLTTVALAIRTADYIAHYGK